MLSGQACSSDTPRGAWLSSVLPTGPREWPRGGARGRGASGDPQPPAAPGAHREQSSAAGQGQAPIPAPIPAPVPAPLPTSSFLGCQALPGSAGIWIFSPGSYNSPVQLRGSRTGIGVNGSWVTFWMCPRKFSGLEEGGAVGIWAEIAEFGLCGKAAWKSCSGTIPPWAPRGELGSLPGTAPLQGSAACPFLGIKPHLSLTFCLPPKFGCCWHSQALPAVLRGALGWLSLAQGRPCRGFVPL